VEAVETDALVMNASHSSHEALSLRRELESRILFQNTLLIVSVGAFALFSAVAALASEAAWPMAVALNTVILAAALQWCHHGVRTMQIKRYLLLINPDEKGWEHWLPANRPRTLLGSRWMISTKGVFLGLGLVQLGLAALLAPAFLLLPALGAAGLWLATAGFLFTNPKE
jgi:hypothetical protein